MPSKKQLTPFKPPFRKGRQNIAALLLYHRLPIDVIKLILPGLCVEVDLGTTSNAQSLINATIHGLRRDHGFTCIKQTDGTYHISKEGILPPSETPSLPAVSSEPVPTSARIRRAPISRQKERLICNLLIEKGETLFRARRAFFPFTKHPEADKLMNNLEEFPHAYVLGCIMDKQVTAERAWIIPYRISERIGGCEFERFRRLTQSRLKTIMTKPELMHRFKNIAPIELYKGIQLIAHKYNGDASLIWSNKSTSKEVYQRFLEFKGIGQKIASMATNGLTRHFKIKYSEYTSVDISADVHVKRVFGRLGLTHEGVNEEQVIKRARELHPEFPGLLDFPTWEIGRKWCHASNTSCQSCYMNSVCTSSNVSDGQ
ncbi:hypothetical protein ACFL39_00620 [Gemmatimonadota bacterium]